MAVFYHAVHTIKVVAVDSIGDVARSSTAARSVWLWPNLLSLDAPLIALLWQILLARDLGLHLNRGEPLVLALCVWFVYLADRILDAMRPPACKWEPARKTFCRDHMAIAFTAALLVLSLILPLAQRLLRPATFYGGLSVAVPLGLYMAIVHLSPSSLRIHWPREVVIAGLFSAGTFLAVWIANGRNGDTLWAPAFLFSLLCWSNCCAIETWEWQANDFCADEQPSDSTRWAARHLPIVG